MILSLFPERRFYIFAKQTNHYFEFCIFFFIFLLTGYNILKKLKIMVCWFHRNWILCHSGNRLKIIHYLQTWQPGVKMLRTDGRIRFWNYYQLWSAENWRIWFLSLGHEFGKTFLDSKHVLKVYFMPIRTNLHFYHFPLSLSGWKLAT